MPEHQAIAVRNLRKVFGDTVAVDDVSFQIAHSEIFGFMGHNGAGKTTTIRMLLGLLVSTRGSASVFGHDIVRESIAIRQLAGFLPDGYALPKEMTARRFLRYVGAMFGMIEGVRKARVAAAISAACVSSVKWPVSKKGSTHEKEKIVR